MPEPAAPILIAGFGSIGRRHFRNLRELGYDNFVFYRTRQGTLPDEETSAWPNVTSLDDALACRPQLAIIANPSARHLEVAIPAAQAGCHVLIEKPLAASMEGCETLAKIAVRQRLVTMIGCQYRFHPLLVRLREQLQAGRLGKVIGARAEWGEYLPDWHPWENHRQSYSARSDLGGGVILTLIHPLDYLYWMFGPVQQVKAVTRKIDSLETAAGEDWAEITLDFESGVLAQVHLDYHQRPTVHRLEIWGETGLARWDYLAATLEWRTPDGAIEVEQVPAGFERNVMFMSEMKHFLDCINKRQQTQIPLTDGISVLDIAMRAKQSAAEVAA